MMPDTRNFVFDIPQASLRWPVGTARRQQPSCVHEVSGPGWMGGSLKKESRSRRNWRLHVVPGITFAYTWHRAVHGDAENLVVQSERPAYQTLGMLSGRPYVQLEPHGAIRGPGQLLRSPGNAAEAVNSARVRGSARGDALGVVVDKSPCSHRAKDDGQRYLGTERSCRQVATGDIDQRSRTQYVVAERSPVPPQRDLITGTTLDGVPDKARKAPLSDLAVIGHVDGLGHDPESSVWSMSLR